MTQVIKRFFKIFSSHFLYFLTCKDDIPNVFNDDLILKYLKILNKKPFWMI